MQAQRQSVSRFNGWAPGNNDTINNPDSYAGYATRV
jgi:hypothetical protein